MTSKSVTLTVTYVLKIAFWTCCHFEQCFYPHRVWALLWQGGKRHLRTSQCPCRGRLGTLKTPSCPWRGCPAASQNLETGHLSRHFIAEISLNVTLNHKQQQLEQCFTNTSCLLCYFVPFELFIMVHPKIIIIVIFCKCYEMRKRWRLLYPRNSVGRDIVMWSFVCGWVSEWVGGCLCMLDGASLTLYLVDMIETTVFAQSP